jgi:hypothetical protein
VAEIVSFIVCQGAGFLDRFRTLCVVLCNGRFDADEWVRSSRWTEYIVRGIDVNISLDDECGGEVRGADGREVENAAFSYVTGCVLEITVG